MKKMSRIFIQMFFLLIFSAVAAIAVSDKYEPDNTRETANILLLNPMIPEQYLPAGYEWEQIHNFYTQGDEDWVKFNVIKGEYYRFSVSSPGKNCDPVIEIYNYLGQKIKEVDDYLEGEAEYAEFKSDADGIYYAKIRQCDVNNSACYASYGEDTEYHLSLTIPSLTPGGTIKGYVIPNVTTAITVSDTTTGESKGVANSRPDGIYFIPMQEAGTFGLTAKADCYNTYTETITVNPCPAGNCRTSDKDYSTKIDLKLTSLPGCVEWRSDFALKDICAEFKGSRYRFTLNFYPNPSDSAGFYWKMDISTIIPLQDDPGNCVKIGDNPALELHAAYQEKNYGFTMNFYPNPIDSDGLYWKMDTSTLKEK
jgi:hypothetical protein